MPGETGRDEDAMQDESTLIHREHVSDRPFDTVVAAFEAAVGAVDDAAFRAAVKASTSAEDFEGRMRAFEGPSGFISFMRIDHGAWLARIGQPARAVLYILGNPLIARTMLRHDLGVGLHVPVRTMIYEEPRSGSCRVAYDLPSSLMARLGNPQLLAAAAHLDEKLTALAELVSGTKA
jgi:uncharacterized protein (DUF302 family)